jgi:S-adenosyl methyltransferase
VAGPVLVPAKHKVHIKLGIFQLGGSAMNEDARIPPGVDPAKPAPARIYDYLLSGENNFQSDRDAARRIMALVPEIRDCAWANRGFHQRAARWIAGRGVSQFVDIGSGLPTVGNTHDVVRSVNTNCRVVYVDNDPMVRAQSAQLLNGTPGVKVILGDLRDPGHVLADPQLRALIDFSQPVGLLMTAVMHFVADDSDPWGLMRQYLAALAPGSYLALSHLTSDHKPPRAVRQFCRVFARATEQVHFRSRPDVERLFAGMQLVSSRDPEVPGHLCYVGDWEAEDADMADSDGSRWLYCGVARRA